MKSSLFELPFERLRGN